MSTLTKIISLILIFNISFTQQNSSDLYSTQNLYGARSFGLSGSNTAIFNQSSEFLINPASIIGNSQEGTIILQPYMLDTYFYHLTFGNRLNEFEHMVIGLSGFISNNFEKRDVDGLKTGTYSNSEFIFSTSFSSNRLISNLYIGSTIKTIYSKLSEYLSQAILIDFGLIYDFSNKNKGSKIAFTISDFPLYVKEYNIVEEDKETYFNFGYSYSLEKIPVILLYNSQWMTQDLTMSSFGVIFDLEHIELNISFNSDLQKSLKKQNDREILNGFAFGFNIEDDMLNYSFAYKSLSDLGSHFVFGLSKTLN